MFSHILAPEGQFLAHVLGYVEGCCYRVLDRTQGAEAEFLLIVRPVEVIAVHQLPGLRAAEPPEDPVRKPGEEAVDMPRAVLMVLRDKEILHLRAVGFAFVPDELGELLLVLVQIVTVEFGFIQSTSEEEVPGIAQGVLQDQRLCPAERLVQLGVIVLLLLLIPDMGILRVPDAFEGHDLVNFLAVLVNGVKRRNAHSAITSRKTLWSQVPSAGLPPRFFRGPQPCISPDIHRRGKLLVRFAVDPPPGAGGPGSHRGTGIPGRTKGTGERHAPGERVGTDRKGPACRGPSGFRHAVTAAIAVIRDVHLVTDFRLVRPCVQFGVRDEDTFGAVTFPLFQGIRQVNVPAAD